MWNQKRFSRVAKNKNVKMVNEDVFIAYTKKISFFSHLCVEQNFNSESYFEGLWKHWNSNFCYFNSCTI